MILLTPTAYKFSTILQQHKLYNNTVIYSYCVYSSIFVCHLWRCNTGNVSQIACCIVFLINSEGLKQITGVSPIQVTGFSIKSNAKSW